MMREPLGSQGVTQRSRDHVNIRLWIQLERQIHPRDMVRPIPRMPRSSKMAWSLAGRVACMVGALLGFHALPIQKTYLLHSPRVRCKGHMMACSWLATVQKGSHFCLRRPIVIHGSYRSTTTQDLCPETKDAHVDVWSFGYTERTANPLRSFQHRSIKIVDDVQCASSAPITLLPLRIFWTLITHSAQADQGSLIPHGCVAASSHRTRPDCATTRKPEDRVQKRNGLVSGASACFVLQYAG
jgi:hypothetical protein